MDEKLIRELIETAAAQRRYSYAPYSEYRVGAALLAEDGRIFTGCNIENASYPACNCAERTAFYRAVFDGKRHFTAIAIVGKLREKEEFDFCAPCGICRQVMTEFCDPEKFEVVLARTPEEYKVYLLAELIPPEQRNRVSILEQDCDRDQWQDLQADGKCQGQRSGIPTAVHFEDVSVECQK